MSIFIGAFWVLVVLCLLLYLYTRSALPTSKDANFKKFQQVYLVVYLLAMAGDWMQGPYVYALYDFYGMSTHQIEILFVAGFGSSMLFGTIVGSFADKYGRRNNCILYGILYGLACVTKHFNNFWILMAGRFLGGIATSILYSAFESWLVFEHNERGFDSELLGTVFSHAILGNSIVAIGSGLVAQQAADWFGYVSPFDVSLIVLVIMCIVVLSTWSENYGDASADHITSYKSALKSIRTDGKILCLGLIQSLFEGSMYTFVLEWTPALTPPEPEHVPSSQPGAMADEDEDGHRGSIPHGYIFAGFMVAIMCGSSIFKLLSKYSRVESFMRIVLLVSAVSLVVPIMFPGNQAFIFIAFLVFEVCVGIFWPAVSTMRGKYVPESTRATIMNFFRVPLNMIVVFILVQNLSLTVIFQCCVGFLLIATVCQQWLFVLAEKLPKLKTIPGQESKEPLVDKDSLERPNTEDSDA